MASSPDSISMALFCDFENVALGVRDAKYDKFDIKPVLERLLLKGSIVVKKAYCDWDRYKSFKAAMHEANFELIEIPHVRQSGKNSADIRLVVDALDLCYTKSHVDTFVIISGDSDFSPLVSKLRENAKQVIGVGVKQSTSDLLIANCDEFIFYDDLVRDSQRAAAKREARDNPPAARRSTEEDKARREELESRRSKAIDIAVETFEALLAERGESGKIWSSMLKEAIKRRKPDFNESYFGFRAFGNLLEEAQARGLLELGRDEKSGIYVNRPGPGLAAARGREDFSIAGESFAAERAAQLEELAGAGAAELRVSVERAPAPNGAAAEASARVPEPRRGRGRGRGRATRAVEGEVAAEPAGAEVLAVTAAAVVDTAAPLEAAPVVVPERVEAAAAEGTGHVEAASVAVEPSTAEPAEPAEPAAPKRSSAARRRRGAKAEAPVAAAAPAVAAALGADPDPAPAAASAAVGAATPTAHEAKQKGKGQGKKEQKQKETSADAAQPASQRGRGGRGARAKAAADGASAATASGAPAATSAAVSAAAPASIPAPAEVANPPTAQKPAARPRRVRKPKAESAE